MKTTRPSRPSATHLSLALVAIAGLAAPLHAQPETCGPTWYPGPPSTRFPEVTPNSCNYDATYLNPAVECVVDWDPDGPGPRTPVLVFGGFFRAAGPIKANNIVIVDPSTGQWSTFGTGTDARVRSMLVLPNGDLAIGGHFATVDGVPSFTTAIFSVSEQRWIPNGVTGTAAACSKYVTKLLLAPDGDMIAAGLDAPGSVTLPGVRKINLTNGIWSKLGNVAGSPIEDALIGSDDNLYVVGRDVSITGTSNRPGFASLVRYSFSTGAWTSTTSSSILNVRRIANHPQGDLVMTGSFNTPSGLTTVLRFSVLNGPFTALGRQDSFAQFDARGLTCLPNGDILLGGSFTSMNSVKAISVARYTPSSGQWSPIGDVFPLGLTNGFLTRSSGDLLAIGSYWYTPSGLLTGAMRLLPDGTTWQPITEGTAGEFTDMLALPDGSILAAGNATQLSGQSFPAVARYMPQTDTWQPFDSSFFDARSKVNTLLAASNGDIYAGGSFSLPRSYPLFSLARFDHTTQRWHAIPGVSSTGVQSLAEDLDGSILVGGGFTSVGSLTVNNIARLDPVSETWTPIGSGLPNYTVQDICPLPGGKILVNGSSTSGTGSRLRIFDPATNTWTSKNGLGGPGASSFAFDLNLAPDGTVLAAGNLGTVNGVALNNFARYDPATDTATPLGTPSLPWIQRIVPVSGDDYVLLSHRADRPGTTARAVRWNAATGVFTPFIDTNLGTDALDIVVDGDNAYLAGVESSLASTGRTIFSRFSSTGRPWIVRQPASPSNSCRGGSASLTTTIAANTGGATYQWFKDGLPIDAALNPSAATETLTIDHLTPGDSGDYTCTLTNACGSTTSRAATIRICAADVDCSGEVDFSDFLAFFNCYDTLQPCADIDGSTEVDMADFCDFFNAFDQGC
jgi:trimeric autotransporter adhesin